MKTFKLLNFKLAVYFLLAHNGLVSGQLSSFFPFNLFGSSPQSSQPTRAQPQSLPNLFPVLGGGTPEGGRDPSGSGGTWPYFSNSDQQQQLQQQQQQQIGQPSQQPYLQQALQPQQSPFGQTPQQQQSQFQPSYPNQNSQQIYGNQQPQQNWQQQHHHPYLQQPQNQERNTPQQSFNPFNNYPNNWLNNFYPQQYQQQQPQQQPQQQTQQQPQQQPQQQFQQQPQLQPQQTLEPTPNDPRPSPTYPSGGQGQQHQPNDQSSYPNNPNPAFSNNPSYPSGQGGNTLQGGGQTPNIDHSQYQQQPASYPPPETVQQAQQPSQQPQSQAQPQPSQWDDGQYNPGKYGNGNQNGANRPVWSNYDGDNLEGNINAVERSELADVDKVAAPSSWVYPNN